MWRPSSGCAEMSTRPRQPGRCWGRVRPGDVLTLTFAVDGAAGGLFYAGGGEAVAGHQFARWPGAGVAAPGSHLLIGTGQLRAAMPVVRYPPTARKTMRFSSGARSMVISPRTCGQRQAHRVTLSGAATPAALCSRVSKPSELRTLRRDSPVSRLRLIWQLHTDAPALGDASSSRPQTFLWGHWLRLAAVFISIIRHRFVERFAAFRRRLFPPQPVTPGSVSFHSPFGTALYVTFGTGLITGLLTALGAALLTTLGAAFCVRPAPVAPFVYSRQYHPEHLPRRPNCYRTAIAIDDRIPTHRPGLRRYYAGRAATSGALAALGRRFHLHHPASVR